ncbi:predicted protein [Lichtheimia corymbifera JMRC:FSU:9682]|uniref:Transposase n=1 Tax=Lichtheimia corymbifera JMRC:FSU:9682 TaxID=1263082 RepID=A0A068RRK3_9FUNG|nr:predicted protein [Lichtheimia corymbifera JMRC:FSU:9682]
MEPDNSNRSIDQSQRPTLYWTPETDSFLKKLSQSIWCPTPTSTSETVRVGRAPSWFSMEKMTPPATSNPPSFSMTTTDQQMTATTSTAVTQFVVYPHKELVTTWLRWLELCRIAYNVCVNYHHRRTFIHSDMSHDQLNSNVIGSSWYQKGDEMDQEIYTVLSNHHYEYSKDLRDLYTKYNSSRGLTVLALLQRVAKIVLLAQGHSFERLAEMVSRSVEEGKRAIDKMYGDGKNMKYRLSTDPSQTLDLRGDYWLKQEINDRAFIVRDRYERAIEWPIFPPRMRTKLTYRPGTRPRWTVTIPTTKANIPVQPIVHVASIDPGVRAPHTWYSPSKGAAKMAHGSIARLYKYCEEKDIAISKRAKLKGVQKKSFTRYSKQINKIQKRIEDLQRDYMETSTKFLVEEFDIIIIPRYPVSRMTQKVEGVRKRKISAETARKMLTWKSSSFLRRLQEKGITCLLFH